jgi:hypothetical protein
VTDGTFERWARRLARSDENLIVDTPLRHSPRATPALDNLARSLVAPMTRRRAVVLMGGAVVAGSLVRPRRAPAAIGGCTSEETASNPTCCYRLGGMGANDRPCCVAPGHACCSTDQCALACAQTWQVCRGPGRCDDTARMCFAETNRKARANKTVFCSQTLTVHEGCVAGGQVDRVVGWCCETGAECGKQYDDCLCRGVTCGDICCPRPNICVEQTIGSDYCTRPCPQSRKQPCNGQCCTDTEVCGILGCDCPSGKVHSGGDCVAPKEDPGDPNPFSNAIRNMFNMAGESSAAHGGSRQRTIGLGRQAQAGSPAVVAALDALAAVAGQGAAAMLGFRNGKRDSAFRQRVVVKPAKPPTLAAGPGLDAGSARALNTLLSAEARAYALVSAAATALWRARAANAKKNRAATKAQLRASAKFAAQAVTALKRLPALRTGAANALIAGGVQEVFVLQDGVKAFEDAVRSGGLPSYLTGPLVKLGASSADLKRLRDEMARHSLLSAAGAVLIEPLEDTDDAKLRQQLVKQLDAFSRRTLRHPLAK